MTTKISNMEGGNGSYEEIFLIDTGVTDSMAPSDELEKIGISRIGKMSYSLADGTVKVYPFGLAKIEFTGETTAGCIIFASTGAESIRGVTALESVGIMFDQDNKTLKRLPAIPHSEKT